MYRIPFAILSVALCTSLPAFAQDSSTSTDPTGDTAQSTIDDRLDAGADNRGELSLDDGTLTTTGENTSETSAAEDSAAGDSATEDSTQMSSEEETPAASTETAESDAEPQSNTQAEAEAQSPSQGDGKMIRATSLMNGQIYASSETGGQDWQVGEPLLEIPAEWGEVGEVEDLALSPEGNLEGLVVEIGGFLGIGETVVLVPSADIRSVRIGNDIYFLTNLTEEQMRNLAPVDDTMWQ